jgi:hypothetical protein
MQHAHPPINRFNRTGQRFLWSDLPTTGQIALYRWDPPACYTPVLMLTIDPSYELRTLVMRAFTNEYPLPCRCAPSDLDTDIHISPVD